MRKLVFALFSTFIVCSLDNIPVVAIHVIFSWAQIGRAAIFGREIGVPYREIFFAAKNIKFRVKNCYFQHRRSLQNVLFVSVWLTGGK